MTDTKTTDSANDQATVDALEAAFIAGFEAGQRCKPEEWLTAYTAWLTKSVKLTPDVLWIDPLPGTRASQVENDCATDESQQ